MLIYEPLEIREDDGSGSGRWRVVQRSDEDAAAIHPLCDCLDGHGTPAAARACPWAAAELKRAFPDPMVQTPIRLPQEMREWLRGRNEPMSVTVRKAVRDLMNRESNG